jgi:HK97 family phage portal protein
MAQLGVKVMRVVHEQEIPDAKHSMLKLLKHPNKQMRGNQFKQLIQLHLDLCGEAFIFVNRGAGLGREPRELHVLSPDRVWVIPHPVDLIQGYLYQSLSGAMNAYLPEEVIHVKYMHPIDTLRGMSPIQALGFSPMVHESLRAYLRYFLKNNARPDIVFTTDNENLDTETAKVLIQIWNETHQGAGGSGKAGFLGGGFKPVPIASSVTDLDIDKLDNTVKKDVFEVYNFPPQMAGSLTDANRANGETAERTYQRLCLQPRAKLLEEDLYQPLLEMFKNSEGLIARVQSPIPHDLVQLYAQSMGEFKAGLITVQDFLTRLNRPEAAYAPSMYLVPSNVTVADELIPYEAPIPAPDHSVLEIGLDKPKIEHAEAVAKVKSKRIRSLVTLEHHERKLGSFDFGVSVTRWTEELGSESAAKDLLRDVDKAIQTRGLTDVMERLKTSEATMALARAAGVN